MVGQVYAKPRRGRQIPHPSLSSPFLKEGVSSLNAPGSDACPAWGPTWQMVRKRRSGRDLAGAACSSPRAPATRRLPPMQTIDFQLEGDHVELNQLLKLAGLCDSGGAGKALVASGAVRVGGAVELRKTCKIRAGQLVEVGDVRIEVAGG